eukprot:865181-Amorphochlora_amoeboformis.AAC.1
MLRGSQSGPIGEYDYVLSYPYIDDTNIACVRTLDKKGVIVLHGPRVRLTLGRTMRSLVLIVVTPVGWQEGRGERVVRSRCTSFHHSRSNPLLSEDRLGTLK